MYLMKRSFIANTVILTITTQLLRISGLFLIGFLSNKIGPEGIGLFQLISSAYFMASTFAISGIGIAVSRLTAESAGKCKGKYVSNVVGRAAAFSLIIGLTAGLGLFLLSGFIGGTLLADERSILSLKIMSLGLPFMAVTVSIRGYFMGIKKAAVPASQMIFEQAVQLIVLFSIMDSFAAHGLEYACLAIAISFVMSEALSFGYGLTIYAIDRRRARFKVLKYAGINRQILGIALPVAASSYLRSGLRTAENILIPMGLRRFGATESEALSQFGLLGMVMPVLLFPSSFLTAISALLLPELSEANSLNNMEKVRLIFSRVFQFTVMLSLLFSGIFVAFARDFGMILYSSNDTAMLLMLLAPLVPLIYLDFIVDSMLNALNQQVKALKINILDYTLRIGLILMLIPKYGFLAYVAIFYISTLLNAFLSIRRLLIASSSSIKYTDWIIKPLLSVSCACITVKLLARLAAEQAPSPAILALKIAVSVLLYALFLLITRSISRSDIAWLRCIFRIRRRKSV